VYRRLLGVFGPDRYRLGHEVVSRRESTDSVTITLAGGSRHEADLLVCADGVGSTFRGLLLPGAHRRYSGYVAWRGMVPERALDPATRQELGDAISYHVYANSHILVYPIPGPDGSVRVGERLVNFVWYRNYLDDDDLDDLLTDTSGERREISLPPGAVRPHHVTELRAVATARLPSRLAEVVLAVRDPFLQVIYDLEVTQMAFDRTCLIGDAAWVARPHAAAGTAKAAADGWALAEALAAHDTVPEALAAWEPGQMDLGRQLVERTRRIGFRSQVSCTWDPTDPDFLFRLREDGP
jgi:2,6-dihydroxypyridine 3-monooxygenase